MYDLRGRRVLPPGHESPLSLLDIRYAIAMKRIYSGKSRRAAEQHKLMRAIGVPPMKMDAYGRMLVELDENKVLAEVALQQMKCDLRRVDYDEREEIFSIADDAATFWRLSSTSSKIRIWSCHAHRVGVDIDALREVLCDDIINNYFVIDCACPETPGRPCHGVHLVKDNLYFGATPFNWRAAALAVVLRPADPIVDMTVKNVFGQKWWERNREAKFSDTRWYVESQRRKQAEASDKYCKLRRRK
jgi:hypothetical protein